MIYGLYDENGIIFYIGQTNDIDVRMRAHLYEVKIGNNLPKYNKLRKCIKKGYDVSKWYVILEDNIEFEKIDEKEIHYIAEYRKLGYKLKNLTEGGKGSGGFSENLQKKLAIKRIGQKRSEESKKRMSEARIGMKFSEEHKKNLSVARKKRITKPETLEKMRASMKKKFIGKTKKYVLIDPYGVEHNVLNLTDFCRDNGLSAPNLRAVVIGKRPQHKGWSVKST